MGLKVLQKHLEKIWQEVKENIEKKAQKMKGKGRRRKEFKIGDKVKDKIIFLCNAVVYCQLEVMFTLSQLNP